MSIAKQSHAFLVGCFNGNLKPQELKDGWVNIKLSEEEYNYRLSMYYKSHVDAMAEAEGQNRPEFLKDVVHYQYSYQSIKRDVKGLEITIGESVSVKIKNNDVFVEYPFEIYNIDLYFFPFEIVLVSIEIDDSGSDLNLLTNCHYKLVNWDSNINAMAGDSFKKCLEPLVEFLPNKDLSALVKDGNNLKIFQIVQGEENIPDSERLFEIATFSPVPSVKKDSENSHSEAYFNKIMSENSVSTFSNWKALALVDSFTILGGKDFEKRIWQWVNLYYPLVYLRCIFEKTFCFSRNNTYRLDDQQKSVKELSDEISKMEKYYFYSNFSYNFQPNLVYETMVKGIGLKAEREELSNQVRERAKEEEEKRRNRITLGLSAFAVFSIAWDLCSLLMKAFTWGDCPWPALLLLILSVVVIMVLAFYIYRKKK